MIEILIYAGIGLITLLVVGFIVTRLYQRAGKETAFVRTGLGGEKVVKDGGAMIIPVVHEIIKVNMTTLGLTVERKDEDALITKDRMRVNVHAQFFVRVKPDSASISAAAQTLGKRTMVGAELKSLIEGKFVDALRNVAASMAMDDLHEKRQEFVQQVQQACAHDLATNGLELETVSLTGLDQTNIRYFNPDNAFDAEGLTQLTRRIEDRKKIRNDIETDNRVQIEAKNLETGRKSFEIAQETEFARLDQERAIRTQAAEQEAQIAQADAQRQSEIASNRAAREQEAESARITAKLATREAEIAADRTVQERQIATDQTLALARQMQQIAISEKSRDESVAKAQADEARALAVTAEEQVVTARETAVAERAKAIELVQAAQEAERAAIGITVQAATQRKAAEDNAAAFRTEAEGRAEAMLVTARAESDSEKLRAEAAGVKYEVDAAGQRALNEASNAISTESMDFQARSLLLNSLPSIIRESVKPMEAIDSIKIVDVNGLGAGLPSAVHGGGEGTPTNLADSAVSAALRYRAQAPLLDSLMKDIGMDGAGLDGLVKAVGTVAPRVVAANTPAR